MKPGGFAHAYCGAPPQRSPTRGEGWVVGWGEARVDRECWEEDRRSVYFQKIGGCPLIRISVRLPAHHPACRRLPAHAVCPPVSRA